VSRSDRCRHPERAGYDAVRAVIKGEGDGNRSVQVSCDEQEAEREVREAV
jgi:hypothetical protein